MDRNFFLAIVLSLLVLIVWTQWEQSRRKRMAPMPPGEAEQQEAAPEVRRPEPAGRPPPTRPAAAPREPRATALRPAFEPVAEQRVRVETELYRAELSSHGGTLLHWELTRFVDKSLPGEPRVVLTTVDAGDTGELATPWHALGAGDLSRAPYAVEEPDPLHVVFQREQGDVTIRKSYRFEPDSYAYRLRLELENRTQAVLMPTFEVVWRAAKREQPDFKDQALVALHDGEVERGRVDGLGKRGFFGMGSLPMEGKTFAGNVEWAGAELRYFVAALVTEVPRNAEAVFRPIEAGAVGDVLLRYRPIELPPGAMLAREFRGYLGPKERERLEAFGAGLDRSIGQAWAWAAPLSRFFSWMLQLCYKAVPNYGVAIIILTVLVRLATAPLTAKQMRSMKRMGELQPKLKEIQAKYKDDRQRQSQEMMKLYRETGVNPLGGCLPLILQFPVFIGLYYALQSSIDLRQAPFVGWIDDLSRPEALFTIPGVEIPVRVLPLVMGASMILQQRMTPTTMDPQQARMMMTVMPVMFTVLFYQFPSGLVLYWMVSNLLAIGHQMLVNRKKGPA